MTVLKLPVITELPMIHLTEIEDCLTGADIMLQYNLIESARIMDQTFEQWLAIVKIFIHICRRPISIIIGVNHIKKKAEK
jgi:hypothetical protein